MVIPLRNRLRRSAQSAPRAAALLLCLVGAAGCSAPPADATPSGTVAAFARALETGDLRRAYQLMSAEYRERVSFETFRARITRNTAEAQAVARALQERAEAARVRAEVPIADGEPVQLRRSGGAWRIESDIVDFYSQATPRAALESFVRAVEQRRWDVVLALIPDADRGDLTAQQLGENMAEQMEEVERTVALLKASMDAPIEIVGDRATMPYGEQFAVRFLREDGVWKIEDPE